MTGYQLTTSGDNAKQDPDRHGQLSPVKLDLIRTDPRLTPGGGSVGISRQSMHDLLIYCRKRLHHVEPFELI